MAEIKLFYHENGRIKVSRSLDFLKQTPIDKFLWIDLNNVEGEVESQLESFLKIYIQEEEEMEEIEMSSRYIETSDTLVVNSNFLLSDFETDTVSFILKDDILVTVHDEELPSLLEAAKKITTSPRNYPSGYHVMVGILETRVERDADLIEDIIDKITVLSDTIRDADEDVLMDITQLQERILAIRQNIIEKQRSISNLLKSELMPQELSSKLTIIVKDINSLIDHTKFSFDRLDYLQDTFLGLVNINQNKTTKIFTIVSVIFMPPTLVASIYGQNFARMPFLHNKAGFWISMGMMFLFSGAILLYFRKKRWL
ncbi:MAG TPA: magnesium/cobalt transporter CorA [Bacteroidales bacterium]|jgi:magnesium transporter|nr:magnesium/cobalt transporter CorA [Bacteroidales bacterium]OQC03960.1 MAG: Magnesium transport protein CorA [Bacteroidetes bacterium ADurb.Bin090]HPH58076.1 magnesium/cobalt transporter CorA [Bacteroidales bacterium]